MAAAFDDDDMFDEEQPGDTKATDPQQRARELLEEIRIHGELAAVFEGPRKFGACLLGLDGDVARTVQRSFATLEKQKQEKSGPILPMNAVNDAKELLEHPLRQPRQTTGDYHVYRRPGETMIVRWLAGDEVETFYERYKAHVTVALDQRREDESQDLGWRQDEESQAYLEALDALQSDPAAWYLRDTIRDHKLFLLSTLAADEMNILHLCGNLMGLPVADVVGKASAPESLDDDDLDPTPPPESECTWYFKLFSLRGTTGGVERMCFFAYMQRASDDMW